MRRPFLLTIVFLIVAASSLVWRLTSTLNDAHVVHRSSIDDARITESSGLGTSTRWKGFLWTHNDSGDTARLFLLDTNGKTRGVVNLNGANAIDWEDMATSGSLVYVGDIGDNARQRQNITIYRFDEKRLQSKDYSPEISDEQTIDAQKMTLIYPNGAHDAETLIVNNRGEIVIVAKETGAARIYKTAKPFAPNTAQVLALVGTFRFAGDNYFAQLTTGGDLNAREDRVLVRTYADAYEWKLPRKNGVPDWRGVWKTAPRRFALPKTRQGEAICYDGNSWVVSSEGQNAPLQWLKY